MAFAVFYHSPSANPPDGVLPAPRPGSLLVLCKHRPKAVPVYGESGRERQRTAERGTSRSWIAVFSVPPQSIRLTAYCQLPRKRWSLLACAITVQKLSPQVIPPQPIRLTAYCQLPRKRWSLLVCASTTPKAVPVYGESGTAQAVTKGVRLGGGFCGFLLFPLSQSA